MCSNESVAFVKAFDDDTVPLQQKFDLYGKAIDQQVKYTVQASSGRGVDRHLLGLRCMLRPGETASIFTDPSYVKGMYFKLTSSNVSPGDYLYGGFGPVVPDGMVHLRGTCFASNCRPFCFRIRSQLRHRRQQSQVFN